LIAKDKMKNEKPYEEE